MSKIKQVMSFLILKCPIENNYRLDNLYKNFYIKIFKRGQRPSRTFQKDIPKGTAPLSLEGRCPLLKTLSKILKILLTKAL